MKERSETELLRLAHKQYRILSDMDFERNNYFIAKMKFAFNIEEGHWNANDIKERNKNRRPHLTNNLLSKFIAQVVNQERMEVNFGDVIPVDDISDPAGAKIRTELIEDIEYQSNVDEIYTTAGEYAVGGGFGFWRIISEYTKGSWDQGLKLKLCENPLNVHKDPRGNYAFITDMIPDDEFKEEYPDIDPTDWEGDDDYSLWYADGKVRIAEWYLKEHYDCIIAEIVNSDGEIGVIEFTKENEKEISKKVQILRTRKSKSHKIVWRKLVGNKIIKTEDWAGEDIPIVEVVGHQIKLQGKTYKLSLTHDAEDANKMLDYTLTAAIEKWQLSVKAPYLVTPAMIKGFEPEWANANITNSVYQLANYDPLAGMPKREMPPAIDSAAMQFLSYFSGGIKEILGMDESTLGMRSNERSGKAIMARNARSDITTYAFSDNLKRAKVETKKMLLDLIPKYYDSARIIRLLGTDNRTPVPINFPMLINGEEIKINDLSKGRYDYRVKQVTSPSRRQQISDNMKELMQYAPPEYGDIVLKLALKYSDTPGADAFIKEIEQRAKELQATEQQGQPPTSGTPGLPPAPVVPPNI